MQKHDDMRERELSFSDGTMPDPGVSVGERPVWQTPAVSVLSLTQTLSGSGLATDSPNSSRLS